MSSYPSPTRVPGHSTCASTQTFGCNFEHFAWHQHTWLPHVQETCTLSKTVPETACLLHSLCQANAHECLLNDSQHHQGTSSACAELHCSNLNHQLPACAMTVVAGPPIPPRHTSKLHCAQVLHAGEHMQRLPGRRPSLASVTPPTQDKCNIQSRAFLLPSDLSAPLAAPKIHTRGDTVIMQAVDASS